jgi:hypothetical protein
MHNISLFFLAFSAVLMLSPCALAQADQQSGGELRFENVDEIQNRPSDIHIGSDPEYRPGLEDQYGGSDQSGYKKKQVESDKVYIEERTYYKRVDGKEEEPAPPPSRLE